jgi:hypothetical protein
MDSPCLLGLAESQPWAVRLLHTSRDDASVFELIGPGTAHPDLTDRLRTADLRRFSSMAAVTYQWTWTTPTDLRQVSVGEAGFTGPGSTTTSVAVQIEVAPGRWTTVVSAPSAVGDGAGYAPFLLAARPVAAGVTGVRVVVGGHGPTPAVADVHALVAGAAS